LVLAESDPLTASLVEHRVEAAGGTVVRCESVGAALNAIAEDAPDAVVVEARLPGGGGFSLLQRLRQREETRFLPVVFVSWPGNEQDVVRAFESSADDYLLKPFAPTELVARVRRHVERYRTWEEERAADTFRLAGAAAAEPGFVGRYTPPHARRQAQPVEADDA
jgi:two-component system phosphate regulon response regulator PhoB